MSSSQWWPPDHPLMKADNKSTKSSSLSTTKRPVHPFIISGYIALKDLRRVAKDLGELTDDNTLQEMN